MVSYSESTDQFLSLKSSRGSYERAEPLSACAVGLESTVALLQTFESSVSDAVDAAKAQTDNVRVEKTEIALI